MRRRVHRWTEGNNPTLVSVVDAVKVGKDEYQIVGALPVQLGVVRCTQCGGPIPKDGGYTKASMPFCRKTCIRAHDAKRPHNGSIVGLDLSLRATACAAIPLDWATQDLAAVRMKILGAELTKTATREETIDRMIDIADGVIKFCHEVQARGVFLEDHAFGMGGQNANQTIEMTGIVKAWLREHWGVAAIPVASASARKTLLQHVPSSRGQPKGFVKKFVARNVQRLGPVAQAWTLDEIDAFVVANHGLMVRGGVAMTFMGE